MVHLADSGHANGTPDHNEALKYRSVGGYFILIADPEMLQGKPVKANILAFHSAMTKRVCSSTRAAEASRLAVILPRRWKLVMGSLFFWRRP